MSSKAWRWTKRITLGLIAFVVLAVAGALMFLHTDYGRDVARAQVEARMNQAFIGGAKIGSLDGSVLGTMVLRDVVINGPDKKPAVTIKKLSLGLGILPLFTKQARVKDVVAEGVEIDLRREPDGQLQTARMVRANDEKSGWAVQLPSVLIKDAHLRIQGVNGAEDTNIDHIYLSGGVYMPSDGPVRANVAMMARWRERDVPMWLDTSLRNDQETLTVGSLLARIGDVQVTAAGVRMIRPSQPGLLNPRSTPMVLSGLLAINGTKAAIEKLLPGVDVPVENVDAAVVIAPRPLEPWTHVTLRGSVDREPVHADIDVDLDARRARGFVSTGRVNLTKITKGRIEGIGSALITFDAVYPLDPDVLPVGGIMAHVGGDVMGLQNALATIAVTSTGEQAAATLSAVAVGASAQLGGQVKKHGDRLVLESGRVLARVNDPSRATKGKAPVHGSLYIDATASGVLSPKPDLSVSGLVVGSRLRAKDLRIGSVRLAIAGSHLPSRPIGKAELKARDISHGNVFLRELDLNAANREDGKIAVTMRSRPKNDPWLVEADALVTPGDSVVIDLLRHKVRVATGTEWTGDSGQIVIGKQRVEIRDVSTTSKDGAIAIAGELQRATGNIKAHIEVAQFALNSISKAYAGTIGARIDIERTAGRFAGIVDIDVHGVVISPKALPLDGYARIEAAADKLVIDATANNKELGTIDFDLDLDAPKNITNVDAWKRLRRSDIRSGQLQLTGIDAGRIAQLANVEGQYGGRIDGDIRLSPTTVGGLVQIKELYGPALKNLGPLSANVTITQTGPTTLQPTLVATIDDRKAAGNKVNKPLAKIEAQATLGAPDRLFDPAAWQQLGAGAFEGATVKVEDVLIEPPLLDRLQITTNMRGRASFEAQIAAKLEGVKAKLALRDLRGNPLEAPVSVDVDGEIDNVATTATLAMTSPRPFPQRLLDVRARIPISLAALRANPRAFRDAKLEATITLPEVPAARVASTFGRSQITGGLLHGTIDITGTVAKPLVKARIAGTKIAVPPGPRGKPIKTIERLSLNADWDGTSGKLDIDATQEAGSLSLDVQGNPKQLDAATLAFSAKAFDIMPLLAFAPGPAGGAAGRLDGKLAITGLDPRRMKIAGDLHLTNGRVPIAPAIGTLRRAKIDVVVGKDLAITIDGKLGGGDLRANVKLGLDGAMPTGGDAKIELRKTSPIGTVEPEISADITAKLTRRPDAWVTDIKVAHGWLKVPGGRGEKLDPVGKPDDMIYVTQQKKLQAKAVGEEHRPARPSFIANIVIDPTFVESTELRGYLKGNLKIQSDADTMGVVGTIEAVRGELDLFGRRYQLDRAVVRFDGSTDPLLDIVVTHDFPEVTTRTAVRGRLSKPELMMSANPNTYSQGQLLGFLLGGEPAGQPADGNPRDQALSAGASIVANKITGYVKQALPIDIDVLRYESATAASGAAVTVGTWLSRSLFVAYRRRIEARPDENSGEGEIEYWLTRRVVIEGVVGDRGFNGVDLLWRRRY